MSSKRQNLSVPISDSFLRSYSISRIVRINEENINKAKVTVMRKIKALRKQNRQKVTTSPSKQHNPIKKCEGISTDINSLKQQLNIIEGWSGIINAPKYKEVAHNQCDIVRPNYKICHKNTKQDIVKINQLFNHRRFNSQAINNSIVKQPMQFSEISQKMDYNSLKAELRQNQIGFQQAKLLGKNKLKSNSPQESQNREISSCLSKTLSSFSRLKLATNTKSSEKIMEHFYQRSLQTCTLEDLNYFMLIQQQNRKGQEQNPQNIMTPMRFGRLASITKKLQSQSQQQSQSHLQQKRTVWDNQVLKKRCPLNQKNKTLNLNTPELNQAQNFDKRLSQDNLRKRTKGNNKIQQKYSFLNNTITMKEAEFHQAQMQKDLVYCYRNKRFPSNDNKLMKMYQNLKKQHLKKKNLQDFKKFITKQQRKQIKTKSIKLEQSISDQQKQNQKQNRKRYFPTAGQYQMTLQLNNLISGQNT